MGDTAISSPLSSAQIEHRIREIDGHIDQLREFDVQKYSDHDSSSLVALQASIRDTLERCFGHNKARYTNFQAAGSLYPFSPRRGSLFTKRNALETQLRDELRENIERATRLLQSAQVSLRAELVDAVHRLQASASGESNSMPLSRRVFVVHGHDGGAREAVARFLEKIGFEAIILHEQANLGRTVIEKVEAHGDVSFAVVLLTPDDEGCVKGGDLEPRARQNVLLELGYFIGRLGRGRVCALKQGALEIPSDFAGVVWEPMDGSGGWKQALGRELEAAGHVIEWNHVMRP